MGRRLEMEMLSIICTHGLVSNRTLYFGYILVHIMNADVKNVDHIEFCVVLN